MIMRSGFARRLRFIVRQNRNLADGIQSGTILVEPSFGVIKEIKHNNFKGGAFALPFLFHPLETFLSTHPIYGIVILTYHNYPIIMYVG